MKGRKRTPTPVLKLRGSWRAKTRPGESSLPVERPEAPAFIHSDAVAMEEWEFVVSQMEELRTLAKIHRMLIASYCLAVSRLTKAQAVLDEEGQTQLGKNGDCKRPEVSIVETASRDIKGIMAELCITPGSQSRVTAKPAKAQDKKAKFFGA